MYSFSYESHPIIRILSLSKQIHISNETKSPFLAFSKKINEYSNQSTSSDSKKEKKSVSDPLKAIADVSFLLQSIKYRTFSDEDLHKIYEMILKGSTLTEIDDIYEFAFPFFKDSLAGITLHSIKNLILFFQKRKKSKEFSIISSENPKNKKSGCDEFSIDLSNENVIESLSIFIFFIFYSSISWMANSEKTNTSEGIFILLEKLNLIILLFTNFVNLNLITNDHFSEYKDKFFINFTQVRKLAIDTFLFVLYYAAAKFPEFTFSDEVFDLLNDFYSKLVIKNKNLTKIKTKQSKKRDSDVESENDTFLNSVHLLLYFLSIELNKNSKRVPALCDFISQVIENQNNDDLLSDKLYLHIFQILAGKLSELDETILRFFVRLSAQFNFKEEKVLINFPNFMINFLKDHTENPIKIVNRIKDKVKIEDNELILINEIENVPIINYRSTVQNFQFKFLENPTFENGLVLTQSTEVPPPLRNYLPNEAVIRIDLVSELFDGTIFTEQFMKILVSIDKENNFEDFLYYLAAFLLICEEEEKIEPHFIMTIFNSPLFEGKYMDYKNEKKFISSLIYSSISLLVRSDSLNTLMEPVVNTKLYLPTVLTTIFQDLYILVNYNLYHEKNKEQIYSYFKSQSFIFIFYSASLFYQNANINDRENIKEIEKCRVSLLLFMESFIQDWSDSRFFNLMFLSYLFEPSLQQFVLSHFNLLWQSENCDPNFFTSIFESCLQFLDTNDEANRNKAISLMYEVLKAVNLMILRSNNSKKKSKPHAFISLHKQLTNILLKLKKDEIEFICEIIEYFSLVSDSNCIDPSTIQNFSYAIQKIGMTNEIRSKLIRLLAGNQAPSIVSHFSIEQPYALPLFVTLFISENNSSQLIDNFKLLEQLVSFSNKNAIMCHKGNLDFTLLDFIDNCISIIAKKQRQKIRQINLNLAEKSQFELYLSNYFKVSEIKENTVKKDDEEDNINMININLFKKVLMKKDIDELKKEIEYAMPLFIKISLVKSSIQIVRKYISLLSTSLRTKALLIGKNDQMSEIYNKIASFYFNSLTDLISIKFRMPITFLPISEIRTPEIEINNISSSYFQDGFTATFWIYLIQQSVKNLSVLFTLSDSNNNEISAKIIDTSFIIIIIHDSKKKSFTLNTVFPAGQWFLTSVTILRDKKSNIYTISASVNSNSLFFDCQTDYFELVEPITIKINGKENNSVYLSNARSAHNNKRGFIKRSASTITYNKSNASELINDNIIVSSRSGSVNFVPEVENNESDDCALLGPFGFFKPLPLINIIQMQQSGPRCIPTIINDNNEMRKSTADSLKIYGINSYLAPTLFPFDVLNTNSDTNELNAQNPSVKKIFYISFDKINGVFSFINDDDALSKSHRIFLKGPKYHQTLSFDEILVQFFKIQSLIPLFKYEEENADEIVSLFSMVLSVGTYVQTNFHQCHGFSMISHILKKYDPKHLTYSLYSKFVKLNNQLTVEELKNDLIKNIIVRFDLWCLSSSTETTQRIIKHWLLINSNFGDSNFISNFKTFNDIMFSLDLFKDVQLKQNLLKLLFKVENNDQISLENTNNFIKFIICQSETYKADVSYLLEFLIENCQYFAATNSYVNLASLLSSTNFSNKENKSNINFIIIELFNKLYKNKKIQKPHYFNQLINTLIDLIPLEIFEEEKNILKLIEYSKTIPECLSILFYGIAFGIKKEESSNISLISESGSSVVFSSNDDNFNESDSNKNLIEFKNENDDVSDHLLDPRVNIVIENLKANGNYCFSKKWFLWPIIAVYKVNNSFFTNFLMNFIVNSIAENQNNKPQQNNESQQNQENENEQNKQISSKYNWMNVFVLINLVGESISHFILNKNIVSKLNKLGEINTFNITKAFLNALFLKEKESDELIEFLNLCYLFIFFKPLWFENSALQLLYNKSSFRRSSHRRSSSLKSNKINKLSNCTKLDIFNQLKENFKKERNYKFSLRFDDDGNWIDRDFAIQIFEETSQLPEFSKINKTIKFLINKQNPVESKAKQTTPRNFNSYIQAFANIIPFMTQINNLYISLGKSITKEFQIPDNNDLINSIKSQRSLFNRNIKIIDEFCYRCWSQLWITLNAESMPWRLKITPNTNKEDENQDENDIEDKEFIKQLHYQYPHQKLDFTPCYALCPMKLKKDFHYVKHKSLREVQLIELQKLYRKKIKKDENEIETKKFMKKIIEKISKTREPRKKSSNSLQKQQQPKKSQTPDIFSFFSYFTDSQSSSSSPKNTSNNESIKNHPIVKIRCELITIKRKMKGHCYFYNDKVELSLNKPIKEIKSKRSKEQEDKSENNANKDIKFVKKIIEIYYDEIRLILSRPILHRYSGIEIFTYLKDSYLLNFPRLNSSEVLSKFMSICPNKNICILTFPSSQTNSHSQISFSFQGQQHQAQLFNSSLLASNSESENSTSIYSSIPAYLTLLTNWWKNGYVSNFSYLIELNMLSGRSFNDPSMYPVFPWIVSDYECSEIRWKDKDFYRDLSLPVGALNKERLEELIQRRKEMIQFNSDIVFLYGAGYSTPLSLFNWMIRLEPFASLHVEMQNGHFDHPHRMFYSIKTAYKLSTSNSNDYRELIPEFFFLPGFLQNKNEFNFGCLEDSFNTFTDEDFNNINSNNDYNDTETESSPNESDSIGQTDSSGQLNINEEKEQTDNNGQLNINEEKEQTDNSGQLNINEEKEQIDNSGQLNINEEKEQTRNDDKTENEELNKNEERTINEDLNNENSESKKEDNDSENNSSSNANNNQSLKKKHRIDDVELPCWATSPIDFIYKHRKILESKYVSRHLNEWIDLIFGVEQKNQDTNQFHPWMYPDVWEKRQQQVKQRSKQKQSIAISPSTSYNVNLISTSSSTSSISLSATNSDRIFESKSFGPSETIDKEQETTDEDIINIPSVLEIEEFLAECGQIPQQLFSEKHPIKQKMKKQTFLKEDLIVGINLVKKNGVSTGNSTNDSSSFFFSTPSQPAKDTKEKIEINVDFAAFVRKGKVGSNSGNEVSTILIFVYVTEDGSIVKATVSINGIECDYMSNEKGDKNLKNENVDQYNPTRYQYFRGYLASSSEKGIVKIANVNNGKKCAELKGHIGRLNCLSSDQVLLVSSGSDTLTNIYDHKLSLLYSVPSFRGEIISSYVNSHFSIIASITLDNSLFLISTSTGTITKVISLHNRRPLSVIVTNAWGFIVVFAEENIYNKQNDKSQICYFFILYSIDGEKICEKKVDFLSSISAWTTFTSCNGFDFLAICDDKGDLFVFEVYPFLSSTLIKKKQKSKEKVDINDDLIDFKSTVKDGFDSSSHLDPIFKSNMDVITLFYWSDFRIIVGIGSNGHSFFVPLDYH